MEQATEKAQPASEQADINTTTQKRGAADAGRYFKYMAEFVGFTAEDADTIKQTKPIIEKHLPEIVTQFYAHLLRYPPTRKIFLRRDGSVDQEYVELRMRHLTNFWLRTASGEFDDSYASYVDYVGRAHTSHGADPHIYIAERYVIGQVGFVQHAISEVITRELRAGDPDFEFRAGEAWDKLMMVLLEMLSRAYSNEREAEAFDPLVQVDQAAMSRLAKDAFDKEQKDAPPAPAKRVAVARASEIPEGERKIVLVDGQSVGVFHHQGGWYAIANHCLHRGGPVATGTLEGNVITCPWHGFQYDLTNGKLLVDLSATLPSFAVVIEDGNVLLVMPDVTPSATPERILQSASLKPNEFQVAELAPGRARLLMVDGESVAVFNVGGTLYATQEKCTHYQGPLSEGTLTDNVIECPLHGSRFNVTNGSVVRGPATKALKTYSVTVTDGIALVEKAGA